MKFSIQTQLLKSPFFPATTSKKKQFPSHNSCPGLCPQSLYNKKPVTRTSMVVQWLKDPPCKAGMQGQGTKTPHATEQRSRMTVTQYRSRVPQ